MTHHHARGGAGGDRASGGTATTEYRLAHLQERLAREGSGDMGIRLEIRGGSLLLTGTVPSAAHREEILRIVAEVLPDVPVRSDIGLTDHSAPGRPEELS
ncbi:BON domain-containing protein [Streptomyces sp. F63]|uniref:BON domain-containing protein n=1 Tax=Streptomyces sp. F63 TaxID=2824887 RepID=UPI001B35EC02|nr:BON domain-containing protein [Streptomyces sp. F63]MBQ0987872.1 BON domain-containing protein [Streptomyces sp. F63]